MSAIIYDVAVSIDGFIAGPASDVSKFPHEGPHVDAYTQRLQNYGTVIMGRNTYEFGYAFGLPAGARAYPHMEHFIFSKEIDLPKNSDVSAVREDWLAQVDKLKATDGPDIYLCGGGAFAGFLLDNNRIDILKLKCAPILYGQGIRLFGDSTMSPDLTHAKVHAYENGVVYREIQL